jgi:hypothetical protein
MILPLLKYNNKMMNVNSANALPITEGFLAGEYHRRVSSPSVIL